MEETFMIKQLIIQLKNIMKLERLQQFDYTTVCLLDYPYFDKSYKLVAADLSKQKALDADPKAIQQIVFTGGVKTKSGIYYILEQSKETVFELYKGTANVL